MELEFKQVKVYEVSGKDPTGQGFWCLFFEDRWMIEYGDNHETIYATWTITENNKVLVRKNGAKTYSQMLDKVSEAICSWLAEEQILNPK